MIRYAQLQDLPAIEDMLLKLKRRTEFCTVKVEFERGRKSMRQCISAAMGFAMVAEHDGKITGILAGAVDHFWYSTERFAADLVFYSQRRGDGSALFDRFKDWADAKNARVLMGMSSGLHQKAMCEFYRKKGLVPIGATFIGEKPIRVPNMRSVNQ